MIDWDYESRLIDRIDARRLLAGIEPRRRRMVLASYMHGATYREIAEAEGISTGRTGQLVNASMAVLRARARVLYPPPGPVARLAPPRRRAPSPAPSSGWQPYGGWRPFDPVEFLKHMRALIVRRADAERQMFARERAELDRMLDDEESVAKAMVAAKAHVSPPKPKLMYLSPPPPKPPPVPHYFGPVIWQAKQPTVQYVEPWFDLTKPLTVPSLQRIALYALQYFQAANRPLHYGLQRVGTQSVRITCERTADAIAGALKLFSDGLRRVWLSAVPVGYVEGAVIAKSDYVALRLTSDGDRSISIELTWDQV